MELLKEGQRVRVKSLNIKGKITYIDQPSYFLHHLRPIQIDLDKPYDDHIGQTMYRTDVKDVVRLKKKVKQDEPKSNKGNGRKRKSRASEEVFDFTDL